MEAQDLVDPGGSIANAAKSGANPMSLGHSPIKVNMLENALQGYRKESDKAILLDGFSKGFSLNYEGPRGETECHNLKSIQGNELVAMKLVLKEVILDMSKNG